MAASTTSIGNFSVGPGDDPRIRPELAEALRAFGLAGLQAGEPVGTDPDKLTAAMEKNHNAFTQLYEVLPIDLPEDADEPKVAVTTISIVGVDGNDIKLHVFKKSEAVERHVPAVVYFHGGGMCLLDTRSRIHDRWATSLALQNLIVIVVDFRNAWTAKGYNPFPAGLNDCASAVKYVSAHKAELGISKVIVQGESGGGNFALAVALKAKREGWSGGIDGVYAHAPYINGAACAWAREQKQTQLPSLAQNDGYLLVTSGMIDTLRYYTPQLNDWTNTLAWPYNATVEDVEGLPPHVIVVDELDPVRDEGLAYFEKLQSAGVKAEKRIIPGVIHCTYLLFRSTLPKLHAEAAQAVAKFVEGL